MIVEVVELRVRVRVRESGRSGFMRFFSEKSLVRYGPCALGRRMQPVGSNRLVHAQPRKAKAAAKAQEKKRKKMRPQRRELKKARNLFAVQEDFCQLPLHLTVDWPCNLQVAIYKYVTTTQEEKSKGQGERRGRFRFQGLYLSCGSVGSVSISE